MANPATILITVDLVIALTLGSVWMVMDARKRGATVAPYVALTALTGSAGLMLYLLRRPEAVAAPSSPALAPSPA